MSDFRRPGGSWIFKMNKRPCADKIIFWPKASPMLLRAEVLDLKVTYRRGRFIDKWNEIALCAANSVVLFICLS